MTGTTRSSEGLDERRRRAAVPLLASRHPRDRSDAGRFADAAYRRPERCRARRLERLLDVPTTIYCPGSRASGAVPPEYSTRSASGACVTIPNATEMRAHDAESPADLLKAGQPLTLAQRRRRRRRAGAGRSRARDCGASRTRRRSASWSSAATARAWRRCRARSSFFAPDIERSWNFRPGIACPTTACRRMPACWRSA